MASAYFALRSLSRLPCIMELRLGGGGGGGGASSQRPWTRSGAAVCARKANCCSFSASAAATHMVPRITFAPPARSLFDRPLAISVEGLRPLQEVTLRASLEDDKKELYESFAFYRADSDGRLDLSRSPALEGGSFSGLEPMGLLWAMKSRKPFLRLVKRDVQRPFRVELEVLDGHRGAGEDGGPALAKGVHERYFLGDGVTRVPVREGNVRATLFLPPGTDSCLAISNNGGGDLCYVSKGTVCLDSNPNRPSLTINIRGRVQSIRKATYLSGLYSGVSEGNGPFPGIIDIYGTGGGLPEYRACLMAHHGFAMLALAYYGYDDLPKEMKKFQLEYFEEAINYMLKHPKVQGPGIGLLGHSKGGDLCVSMASFLKGITATVTINGSIANVGATLTYKDVTIPFLGFSFSRIKKDKSGIADILDVLNNPFEDLDCQSIIPVEKAEGHFLFIVGEDDRNWKSGLFATEASKRLQAHGKEKPEIISYPAAGHYIEPPYFPMCAASMHFLIGCIVGWGGEPKAHAAAQVDAWQHIQTFFHKHLGGDQGRIRNKL